MKKTTDFKIGTPVCYISKTALKGESGKMVETKNLGRVTSVNDKFVFVRYNSSNTSQATDPEDLFFLNNRPDLVALIKEK